MQRVVIASKNPVKIDAARIAFTQVFPETEFEFIGQEVDSGVSSQPMSDAETLTGARNRVKNILQTEADYWVGIEGGIEEHEGSLCTFAWIVIKSKKGIEGRAKSALFVLPTAHTELIKGGMELGHADDIVFGLENSKQKLGTVGSLTHNLVNRTTYYIQPAILALIPFINPQLYSK